MKYSCYARFLNTPHVAGLDKTVGILLDADSLEMVAYKEFAADKSSYKLYSSE